MPCGGKVRACQKCVHWTRIEGTVMGLCRRNPPYVINFYSPPVVDLLENRLEAQVNLQAWWPQTPAMAMCGEFSSDGAMTRFWRWLSSCFSLR